MTIQKAWDAYCKESKQNQMFPQNVSSFLEFHIQKVEIIDEDLDIIQIGVQCGGASYTLSCYEQWLINQTMTLSEHFGISPKDEEKLEEFLRGFNFLQRIIPSIEANKAQMVEKWNRIHKKYFKKVRLSMIVEKPSPLVKCIETLCFDEAIWVNKNQLYQYFEITAHNEEGILVFKKDKDINDFTNLPKTLEPMRKELREEFLSYIEKLGLESFIRFFEKASKIWSAS